MWFPFGSGTHRTYLTKHFRFLTCTFVPYTLLLISMENKKILAIFATILLIVTISAVKVTSRIHAQQSTSTNNEKIPSDLALDLNLAQQNPAPDQQAIISSETKQAQVVTATGDTRIVIPQDLVAAEVRTESANDAINPEQTTSEQVITVPATVNQGETPVTEQGQQGPANNNPTGTQTDVIPGTSIQEPNDNAAPAESNPEVNPSGTPQDQQNIPPESQPQSNPTSVQGASTGPSIPWWQQLFDNIIKSFRQ